MTRKELISSPEYWIAQMQIQLYEALESTKVPKKEIIAKAGTNRTQLSKIAHGDAVPKIDQYVKILLAMGKVPKITIESLEEQK